MLWMLFSCSWTLSFGTPHSQSPLDSSAANWFSSFFLLLATFAVDVSMCLSFTKCIHSVLLNHLVNLPRRRICNTQRLDNKMRYVKTCLHRTKWIEFHGWRWSDKEVNGMHYIRNFFSVDIYFQRHFCLLASSIGSQWHNSVMCTECGNESVYIWFGGPFK